MFDFTKNIFKKLVNTITTTTTTTSLPVYHIYSGEDNHSYFEEITLPCLERISVKEMYFKSTPAGQELGPHNAPDYNYVLTLSGSLEFTTSLGETFLISPGDILLAEDVIGEGHSWKIISQEPWVRAYITLM